MFDLTADEKKLVLFHLDSMIDRAVEKSDLGMKTTGARKHHVKALLTFIVKRTIGWGKLKEKIKPEHFSGIPGKWDAVSSDPTEDSLRRARNSLVLASLIDYDSSAEVYKIKLAVLLQFTIERLIQPKYATDPGWNRHLIGLLVLRDRLSGAQTSAEGKDMNLKDSLESGITDAKERIAEREENQKQGNLITAEQFTDDLVDKVKVRNHEQARGSQNRIHLEPCKRGKRKGLAALLLEHIVDSERDPLRFISELIDRWSTLAVVAKDKFNKPLAVNPKSIDIEFVYIHRVAILGALDRMQKAPQKVVALPDDEERARRIRARGGYAI